MREPYSFMWWTERIETNDLEDDAFLAALDRTTCQAALTMLMVEALRPGSFADLTRKMNKLIVSQRWEETEKHKEEKE